MVAVSATNIETAIAWAERSTELFETRLREFEADGVAVEDVCFTLERDPRDLSGRMVRVGRTTRARALADLESCGATPDIAAAMRITPPAGHCGVYASFPNGAVYFQHKVRSIDVPAPIGDA